MVMHEAVFGETPVTRVARGSIAAFVVLIVAAGVTSCSQLLIARIVGPDAYGIYAYVFAWISVFACFSALGFDVALLRFVPAYQAERAPALLRGVIQYAERRATTVGLIVVVIGVSVVTVQATRFSPELKNTFLIGFMLVPICALLTIRCSVVRAFGKVVAAVAPDRLVREGVLLGLIAFASVGLGWSIDAPTVMMAALVGSVIGLVYATLAMRRVHCRVCKDVLPIYAAPIWRRTALPLVISGATELLMNRTGVILLGWIGETTNAGIYSLAFNIAFVVVLPRTAVSILFAPMISSLFARKDRAALQVLVTKTASWMLCAAACIALALSVLAEPVLGWFGEAYRAGAPALRILLLGQVIVAGAGSQMYLMTMTGHERSAAILLFLGAATNAAASAALISVLGLTGAAIGTTAALILWNTGMAVVLWRRLRLVPGIVGILGSPFGTAAAADPCQPCAQGDLAGQDRNREAAHG